VADEPHFNVQSSARTCGALRPSELIQHTFSLGCDTLSANQDIATNQGGEDHEPLEISGVSLLVALTARTTPISAQTKSNPSSVWPGQSEGEFIVKDFRFHVGEVLAELRLHYVTLGAPHRNSAGDIDNAVLLLHTTGGDTTELLGPSFTALYAPGQPLDLKKFYVIIPDAIGCGKSSKPSDGLRARFPPEERWALGQRRQPRSSIGRSTSRGRPSDR
jgi:hypothetical protein